jgi:hypothetical protein
VRKSKYNENFPTLAEGYARRGLNDEQIAKNLGVSLATYYEYQKKYPEFLEAIKKGKAPVDMIAENNFLKRVNGYSYKEKHIDYYAPDPKDPASVPMVKSVKEVTKQVPPDVTAGIFWLMNRIPDRWKDKQSLKISGSIATDTQLSVEEIEKMSPKERDKLKKQLIRQLNAKV